MHHLRRITKSFTFAFEGIAYLVRTQANFWVHLVTAACVVLLSVLLGLTGTELAVLILAIGLVLALEALNSAVEAIVDLVSPEFHPLAKIAKDAGAAAVLLGAIAAAAVGVIVLLPTLIARR